MSNIESEALLEKKLIDQLSTQGFSKVTIKDENDLLNNLKSQLEKHNKTTISDNEFKKILNHLNNGSVFDKAKALRDKFTFIDDNGNNKYIEFLNSEYWCQNLFQVTNQVTIEGKYQNRYDVTILINGLPLVQIELKRRGLSLKEAFNQINRYQKHSYSYNSALFNFIQIFIISNGVDTKYYSNRKEESFKQTFFWADKENKNIKDLSEFTETFLEKCHLSKMICKYMVLTENKKLMILRPYQYHAVEAIIERVTTTNKNGYIWHTTGSGKTLTSFKAAQILMKLPKIHKVIFVVDRKDLDSQTQREFNDFKKGSVDGTNNTKELVKQFKDPNAKLIVTTIQKLNTAITKKQYENSMADLKDKHIVFIFDECHRSQFGDTHKNINKFFNNNQMIGFTGTPIFVENAVSNKLGKRTTTELFEDPLHKYVITDAIADENVLKFSIEYIGKYKEKENSRNNLDIQVEDIDTKELLESKDRAEKIAQYIIDNHSRKTHNKEFTAMMCVSSVDMLIKYYEIFKAKEHNLKIATIFSYGTNEDDKDANGYDEVDPLDLENMVVNQHSRDKLEEFIGDYNKMFGSKYTTKDTQSYYNYYNDISNRVKKREIDILLVVNMFLTGFDSKTLNTLYVDKNLKYHGLIQAFSRTNRIINEKKSQGNIVCFRNLKKETDDAIALFSNKNAKDIILMEPYANYLDKFIKALEKLKDIAPTVDSVDYLIDENEQAKFVIAFRDLIKLKNILESFSEFDNIDIKLDEQEFANYTSKYLDIKDKVDTKKTKEKVSVLEDLDFELELIQKIEVNVHYILTLLGQLNDGTDEQKAKKKQDIYNIINTNEKLRSKRELIEKFINENLANITNSDLVEEEFEKFWNEEQIKELDEICKSENLHEDKVKDLIENHIYTAKEIQTFDVSDVLIIQPSILTRKTITDRVLDRLKDFINRFHNL